MIPKFNKQTGRWGVWCRGLELWLCSLDVEEPKPLKFKSKQEAQARIDSYDAKL